MSWGQYLAILAEAKDLLQKQIQEPPVACPNDGTLLEEGPGGVLHCKFDGWTYQ